jgi:hypothetical protein
MRRWNFRIVTSFKIKISESKCFRMHIKVPRKRDFLSLFSNKTDFYKYLKCILIEFRCGFLGVPITFSKFAKALEYKDTKLFQLVKLLLGVMADWFWDMLVNESVVKVENCDSFLLLNLIMVFIS